MKKLIPVFLAILLFSLVFAAPASGQDQISGIVDIPTPESEQKFIDTFKDLGLVNSDDVNVFALYSNGEKHIVITSTEPKIGKAIITPEYQDTLNTVSVIKSDNIQYIQSPEHQISREEFSENPEKYSGDIIKTQTTYRQMTSIQGKNNISYQSTMAMAGPFDRPNDFGTNISDTAGWVVNTGANGGLTYEDKLTKVYTPSSNSRVAISNHYTGFWMDTDAHVTAAVYQVGQDTYLLKPIHVDPVTDQSPSKQQLLENPQQYQGQVVTVETDMIGTAFSAKRVASVFGGVSSTIPTDATVHTGYLFDSDFRTYNVLPVVGTSNRRINGPAEPYAGTVQITGRVIEQNGQYILAIYQLEKRQQYTYSDSAISKIEKQSTDLRSHAEESIYEENTTLNEYEYTNKLDVEPNISNIHLEIDKQTINYGEPIQFQMKVTNTGEADAVLPVAIKSSTGKTLRQYRIRVTPGSTHNYVPSANTNQLENYENGMTVEIYVEVDGERQSPQGIVKYPEKTQTSNTEENQEDNRSLKLNIFFLILLVSPFITMKIFDGDTWANALGITTASIILATAFAIGSSLIFAKIVLVCLIITYQYTILKDAQMVNNNDNYKNIGTNLLAILTVLSYSLLGLGVLLMTIYYYTLRRYKMNDQII